MKISPARKSAFEILFRVEKEKAFSSILLPQYEDKLSNKDSSLCHELVLGILRKRLYIDEIIKKFTKKNLSKFDLEVIIALRLGIYQLMFLDKIPAYSAINESVNIVKLAKKKSASGLVNAVLRKVSKDKVSLEFIDQIQKISVETSHPKWLIERWIKQFGIFETEQIANVNNQIPNLTFRFTAKYNRKDLAIRKEILARIEAHIRESELLDESFITDKVDGNLRELVDKGLIYFQDEGSQIIAASVEVKKDESFLDVCASPGSKATLVAKTNSNKLNVAGDLHAHRIRNLRDNCLNQGLESIDIVQYDAETALPFEAESFDAVLVDAPCTGTGTIRNNPEIRYNLSENDFSELSSKQLSIVHNASKLIKQGGRLIYSTCSLEVEENEHVIEKFLAINGDFEKIKPNIIDKFITNDNFARTFPQRDNTDGFFIAFLLRV